MVPRSPDLTRPDPDYLVFASAGGVKAWWASAGEPAAAVRCVCIGEITARALRRLSDRPILMAEEISAQGILAAIAADRDAQ